MADPATDRDPLEILADEFVSSQRRGESPSVDDYIARHPDLADQIRELFPTVAAMERLKARSERSADGLASLGPVQLEQLGEFRIVREIGRGGMGIVFEAMQESLGRPVALKVLPRQALLEQRHLARFNREAKIASRLHHTNIVQVYGVGQDDGFHYYVMQYVRGVGLDKIFRHLQNPTDAAAAGESPDELLNSVVSGAMGPETRPSSPQYWRFLAETGRQAADAIAYAHDQGTLHRDIKPSNLLLDTEGTVWVTDFGLARAANTPQITQDGDLTGTLRYLAPERLDGRTDELGDIYGLGLTLYELLTLQAAYEETDRSTLIARISKQSPPRPRSIDPSIPRDLETIVLKAISPEPQHRYATAAEMARDLELFIEDRPITARRIGPAERLWRWARRNKAVASLAASTLALILTVAIVATAGYLRTRRALANEARQRQRAEAASNVASEALDRIFSRLGPGRVVQSNLTIASAQGQSIRIVGQSAISKETATLLEEMLPFYDRLAAQMDGDVILQHRAAGARRRIGDIRRRLGHYAQAIEAYRQAVEMHRLLADRDPDNQSITVRIAEAFNELGKTHNLSGNNEHAAAAYCKALDCLKKAGNDAPAESRFELARTYFLLGQRVARKPGSERKPPPFDGERPDHRPPHERHEEKLRNDPNRQERNANLNRAIALLTDLRNQQPDNPSYRHLLALCHREIVPEPGQGGTDAVDQAIELLEELVRDFPEIGEYSFDLCETYAAIETIPPGPPEETGPVKIRRLEKALTLAKKLVAGHPNAPEYPACQARIRHKFADTLAMSRRPGAAAQHARKAVDIQGRLAGGYPQIATYRIWNSAYRNALARILLLDDQLSEAKSVIEANIAGTNATLKSKPELWCLHGLLMDANHMHAKILRRNGKEDLAKKAEDQIETHRLKLDEGREKQESKKSR